jgi:TatD DNase family protein
VIHTREAWDETFDILAAEGMPTRTIFHCFSGGPAEARRCLDLGAYLSFSGIVTFKTAIDLQAAALLCPLDRRLVETDSPYLAPVPHRGRTNQPGFVTHVAAFIARLSDTPFDEVAAASVAATRQAFPALAHPR